MKTLAYGQKGNCVVFVCGNQPFEDGEWDTYTRFLETVLIPGNCAVCLVLADGAGPTAAQRQRLNEAIAPVFKEFKTSVVTSSYLVRGIVTAMGWIYPVYQAFGPTQLDEAIAHLGIPAPDIPAVKQIAIDLRAEFYKR